MRQLLQVKVTTVVCFIFVASLLVYSFSYDYVFTIKNKYASWNASSSFGVYQSHKHLDVWKQNLSNDLAENQPSQFRTPPLLTPEQSRDPEAEIEKKRLFIKEMMKEAWSSYVHFAWGHNELKPLTKEPNKGSIFGEAKIGATLVDSMDTLLIMGMRQEFDQAKDWVKNSFYFKQTQNRVSVFETVIRFVGGLLSCYALTGDALFLDKSKEVAEALLPAYATKTGLPSGLVIPATGKPSSQTSAVLSEMGSQHLEYIYLSDMTGDRRFRDNAFRIRNFLDAAHKPEGLYMLRMDSTRGDWTGKESSFGALGDSFYEYLIKSYIQSNHGDQRALRMYTDALSAIERAHMIKVSRTGLMYISDWNSGKTNNKMQHLTCFAGGMYALGAHHMKMDMTPSQSSHETVSSRDLKAQKHRILKHFEIGKNVTETCYQSYKRTPTKLGPESFFFDDKDEATHKTGDIYILRPEVIESYFVLWRLTHDNRYREYAWQAAQALYRHCRTGNGFSGIQNVMARPVIKDNTQQSFFLAETLKYLYLIFSNDNLISLDEWVFNTEAHPFPICGKNSAYPESQCSNVYH